MAQIFPNGQYGSWTECQRLPPHAKEVMKLNLMSIGKVDYIWLRFPSTAEDIFYFEGYMGRRSDAPTGVGITRENAWT